MILFFFFIFGGGINEWENSIAQKLGKSPHTRRNSKWQSRTSMKWKTIPFKYKKFSKKHFYPNED